VASAAAAAAAGSSKKLVVHQSLEEERSDAKLTALEVFSSPDLNLYAATNRKYIRIRMPRRLYTSSLSLEME
jgi:hypothetical protein